MAISPAVRQDLEEQFGKWASELDEVQLQWASGYLAGVAAARRDHWSLEWIHRSR